MGDFEEEASLMTDRPHARAENSSSLMLSKCLELESVVLGKYVNDNLFLKGPAEMAYLQSR